MGNNMGKYSSCWVETTRRTESHGRIPLLQNFKNRQHWTMMTKNRIAIISGGGVTGSGPVGLLDCSVSSSGHWLYEIIQTLKSLSIWFMYNSVWITSMKTLWKNNTFTSMTESDWEKGKKKKKQKNKLAQSYPGNKLESQDSTFLMPRHIRFPAHQDFILNSKRLPSSWEGPRVFWLWFQSFLFWSYMESSAPSPNE